MVTLENILSGEALTHEIDAAQVGKDEIVLWWLGQHSFVIKAGNSVLYLDIFLSPDQGRNVPPLFVPGEIRNAALVLGSHDHDDHIDRGVWPAIAQASPQATFIVPRALLPGLANDLKLPLDRFHGLDDGMTYRSRDFTITAIPAAHEFFDRDPAGGGYPFLGFIIEANGVRLYHSGDTVKYDGLESKLRQWDHFDAMLLPINGRDAVRYQSGCIGNMTFQEAVDLAGVIVPDLAIPTHFDMFDSNSENPQKFVDYMRVKFPKVRTHVCEYAKKLVIKAGNST